MEAVVGKSFSMPSGLETFTEFLSTFDLSAKTFKPKCTLLITKKNPQKPDPCTLYKLQRCAR
jgi:hypothetical protein